MRILLHAQFPFNRWKSSHPRSNKANWPIVATSCTTQTSLQFVWLWDVSFSVCCSTASTNDWDQWGHLSMFSYDFLFSGPGILPEMKRPSESSPSPILSCHPSGNWRIKAILRDHQSWSINDKLVCMFNWSISYHFNLTRSSTHTVQHITAYPTAMCVHLQPLYYNCEANPRHTLASQYTRCPNYPNCGHSNWGAPYDQGGPQYVEEPSQYNCSCTLKPTKRIPEHYLDNKYVLQTFSYCNAKLKS